MSVDRSTTIGSSDVPAILGLDPKRSAFQVWLEKTHPAELPEPKTEPWQERGVIMESSMARWYEKVHGVKLLYPRPTVKIAGDWKRTTPDAKHSHDEDIVEIKTVRGPQPDRCEVRFDVQSRWHMAVLHQLEAGAPQRCHVFAWYLQKDTPVTWVIDRDPVLENELVALVDDFRRQYIVTRHEPPPEASQVYASYLNSLPVKDEELHLDGDHPLALLITNYGRAQREFNEAAKAKKAALHVIRTAMRELGAVRGPFGLVRYSRQRSPSVTDWEQVSRWIASAWEKGMPSADAQVMFQEIVRSFTKPARDYRVIKPYLKRIPDAESHEDAFGPLDEIPDDD